MGRGSRRGRGVCGLWSVVCVSVSLCPFRGLWMGGEEEEEQQQQQQEQQQEEEQEEQQEQQQEEEEQQQRCRRRRRSIDGGEKWDGKPEPKLP